MEPGPGGGAEHMENKVHATLWPVLSILEIFSEEKILSPGETRHR